MPFNLYAMILIGVSGSFELGSHLSYLAIILHRKRALGQVLGCMQMLTLHLNL